MSSQDIESLFEFLKLIQMAQKEISQKLEEVCRETTKLNLKVAVLEKNVETLADKVDGMLDKCKTHEIDIKKAGDFMLIHDTREKSFLGIRTDIVAWIGLVAAIVATAANFKKLFN